jgi:hypothetical protein
VPGDPRRPADPRKLTRADLPDEFTPESIRGLPLGTLRRLARPGNGILTPEEQTAYDAVLHEVMSETARRVSRQMDRPEWAKVRREANARSGRQGRGSASRVDEQLSRLARRIDQQVGAAEALAPGVDWSFAQTDEAPAAPESPPVAKRPADPAPADGGPSDAAPPDPVAVQADPEVNEDTQDAGEDHETVSDLEQRLTEQVELVQVMSEIAEVGKRTYKLEQQRDLQSTRGVFFGFVVSVAVLVAGWAPVVAADDWAERIWILGLTVGTCVLAGLVYALIRKWQNDHHPELADPDDAA